MKTSSLLIAFCVVVALILFSSSAYTVSETEQVVITQFGDPVGAPINVTDPEKPTGSSKSQAGLHFKTPFIQEVNRFDKRILEWDSDGGSMGNYHTTLEMPTRDKLYIAVDAFARWRITDPLQYFRSLKTELNALSQLNNIIGSETRNVVARHDLIEVIRTDKERKPQVDATLAKVSPNVGVLPTIQFGRGMLEQEILQAAAPKVKIWGIELLDMRFKRVNYKESVLLKIHDRMKSERTQIADRFRAEGMGEAAKIMGRREKDLRQIESDAYRQVQEIQGKADAAATAIYAKAYNTSPAAADFFQFLKTLETYKDTLGRDTTLVITTDSDFFKYLKHIDGGSSLKAPLKPAAAVPAPASPTAPALPPPLAPAPAPTPDKPPGQ